MFSSLYSVITHTGLWCSDWGSLKDERKLVKSSTERSKISHIKKGEGPPSGPVVKNSPCNAGGVGLIPDLGRSTCSGATKDMHHDYWALQALSPRAGTTSPGTLEPTPACSVTSVMSNFVWPPGLSPARLLSPWDPPGKSTRVDCHAHLQGIFLTQGSNLSLLHSRWILDCWATREVP